MSNSYDAGPSASAQDAPAAPDETAAGTSKISQEQANYRMGNPQRSCGLCANFTGSAGEGAYQCTKVEGEISPYGFSDWYARQDNPFIAGVQSTFDEGSEEPETEGPEQPEAASEPRLQIGNRSY
jgi:hypothetical protein